MERFGKDDVFPLDLPRLVSITGREQCFCHRKKVEIASGRRWGVEWVDVPALQIVRLEEGFQETRSARVQSRK